MKKLVLAALLLILAAANGASRPKSTIQIVYVPEANGDYKLFLFGSDRALVCEEKDVKIVQQGDALSPLVLECKH